MAARSWLCLSLAACLLSVGFAQGTAGYGSTFDLAAQLFSGERKDVATLKGVGAEKVSAEIGGLVKKSSINSAGYAVSAFALAVNGVDLEANLGRLAGPLKRAQEGKVTELEPTNGLAPGQVLLEDIPWALYLVYKARKYQPALEALLTAPVDGAVAENRDDVVMDQLREDPVPVLQIASNNPKVYERVWDIVDWNIGPKTARTAFINRLKSRRWPSAALKRTALRLAADLRKPKNRV